MRACMQTAAIDCCGMNGPHITGSNPSGYRSFCFFGDFLTFLHVCWSVCESKNSSRFVVMRHIWRCYLFDVIACCCCVLRTQMSFGISDGNLVCWLSWLTVVQWLRMNGFNPQHGQFFLCFFGDCFCRRLTIKQYAD